MLISVVGVRPGCADCASKNHPEAVKLRTKKEQRQREDRCAVFQWARREGGEQQRCAYWIVQDCPNLKAGKTCDRVHECATPPSEPVHCTTCAEVRWFARCKNCGFTDAPTNKLRSCPTCPKGWWKTKSGDGSQAAALIAARNAGQQRQQGQGQQGGGTHQQQQQHMPQQMQQQGFGMMPQQHMGGMMPPQMGMMSQMGMMQNQMGMGQMRRPW